MACYKPCPEEVLQVLDLHKASVARSDHSDVSNYYSRLYQGTANPSELFKAHPTSKHPRLWEATYVARNELTKSDRVCVALITTMGQPQYRALLRGLYPPLDTLKHWIGHGFGYQAVQHRRPQPTPKRRRALVPGCGYGANALFLAKLCGYDVVALDVSETALKLGRELEEQVVDVIQGTAYEYDFGDGDVMEEWTSLCRVARHYGFLEDSGDVEWRHGDFLSQDSVRKDEKFDFIFDSCFFAALHPSQRPRWAQRMVDVIARPHGKLMCREIPSQKDLCLGGPPYGAPLWFYHLHLTYPGNDKVVNYVQGVINLSTEVTSTSGPGLMQVARFQTEDRDTSDRRPIETWVSFWGPAMTGGRPVETQHVAETDAPSGATSEIQIQRTKKDSDPSGFITQDGAHDSSLDASGDEDFISYDAASFMRSPPDSPPEEHPIKNDNEDDIYGCEPEARVVSPKQDNVSPKKKSPSEESPKYEDQQRGKPVKRVRFSPSCVPTASEL